MGERLAVIEGADVAAAEEDRLLGERMARGEERAFELVVEQFGEGMTRLARRMLGWREDEVEDAVQEIFVRAYLGRKSYRGASSLRTWLTRIGINACRSMRRRRILRAAMLERFWRTGRRSEKALEVGKDEVAEKVRSAVRRLGEKEREVVVLYYLEEFSVREIGEMLGVNEGAVNVRLHRGRARLEEMLK